MDRPEVPTSPMRRDVSSRLSRAALASVLSLAVFVVGHNLHFLLEYGSNYGSDLAQTGDGSSWDATVKFVLSAAGLLATAASLRLGFLYWHVRRRHPRQLGGGLSGPLYVRAVLRIWLALYSASVPMFVVQENFERWNAGLGLPGLGVVGSIGLDSPFLLFALVSLAFALVVALYRLGVDRLVALIAEAHTRACRPARAVLLPARSDPESVPSSVIGRNLAGRAPPALPFA